MAYKTKISINDLKFKGKGLTYILYGKEYPIDSLNLGSTIVSQDLILTDHYISGTVTAHFYFPIHPNDTNFGRWNRYDSYIMYGDIPYTNSITYDPFLPVSEFFNGCGDLLFIEDETSGICVVGTQFYGNSYIDNATPPNVDTAYIPHRYHIKVGDTIEIYSGRLKHLNRPIVNPQY
jgi:hypothetical protein